MRRRTPDVSSQLLNGKDHVTGEREMCGWQRKDLASDGTGRNGMGLTEVQGSRQEGSHAIVVKNVKQGGRRRKSLCLKFGSKSAVE